MLPSPLLGPAMWRPVAAELARRGWQTVLPGAADGAPQTPDDVLRHLTGALPADRDLILLPHSNAGLYVPALTARLRVAGYVFVDAGLPEGTTVPLAAPAFYDFMRAKADEDGLLPPWTRWWGEDALAALFPDGAARAEVEREQRRLPLSYFSRSLPVPAGWDDRPGAYLAFGDTYGADRERAIRRGWPTTTLPAAHLHTLVAPAQVAGEIDGLLAAIGLN